MFSRIFSFFFDHIVVLCQYGISCDGILFLYHSIVGLLIEREKFVNLKHLQRLHTKGALMIMRDTFLINHSNDELLHSCLISDTGQFIIPTNRVLGDSAYLRVLNQLEISRR